MRKTARAVWLLLLLPLVGQAAAEPEKTTAPRIQLNGEIGGTFEVTGFSAAE